MYFDNPYPITTLHWFRYWLRLDILYLDIRCFFQRANKGYSDRDIYNTGYYILSHTLSMVKTYRSRLTGSPVGMSMEQYEAILDKIIAAYQRRLNLLDDQEPVANDLDWIQANLLMAKYLDGMWT